jgi:hypothetical protein
MEMSSQVQGPALISCGKQPSVPIESEIVWNPVCLESLENIKSHVAAAKGNTVPRPDILYCK